MLATKAVHLELVSDLTTRGFLAMLRRFVSRRGLCQHLYCDNGTNFVGANVQVEAVLNSRPLLPLTNDPNDFESLTPGHFLVGHPLNLVPDIDLETTPINRLNRYHMLQSLAQHFWRRWSEQYLHTLHERSKWRFKTDPGSLQDSLVLLKEENSPPSKWTLARIVNLHPGKDGITRVVSVRVANGNIFKRSIVKICPLPISDEPCEFKAFKMT
ncbi:uncharacterized protein LOC126736140 [Anthonomus grandis grandis]|uniref:uncharacterized protein LOC126736140 n=1 Tax=Anthonomus grandis grandis TaxID=2921223 RepID=UPI00216604DA|nr:uncharacterized protein LOC126736140 [Anthonomus grandis grandis]